MALFNQYQESKTLLTLMGQRSDLKFFTGNMFFTCLFQRHLEMELKQKYSPRPQSFQEVLVGIRAIQLGFDLNGTNPNLG